MHWCDVYLPALISVSSYFYFVTDTHASFDRNNAAACAEISRRTAPLSPQARAGKRKRHKSTGNLETAGVTAAIPPRRQRSTSSVARMLPPHHPGQRHSLQTQQHQPLPIVNFWPPSESADAAMSASAASAAAFQRAHLSTTRTTSSNMDSMYLEERKLSPTTVSLSRNTAAPHPHPLDQLLEPRTIEEMMQDRSRTTSSGKASPKSDDDLKPKSN